MPNPDSSYHEPDNRRGSMARAALAALASGALYFVSTGLHPWWPGLWIAPLPVLLLAFTSPRPMA
jgi:hypothetical protein